MTENNLQSFVSNFEVSANDWRIRPTGSGHIHDTYLVESSAAKGSFVLQRINHSVFKDVALLMSNIEKVLAELKLRIGEKKGADLPIFHRWRSLEIVAARGGESYHRDPDGTSWRL